MNILLLLIAVIFILLLNEKRYIDSIVCRHDVDAPEEHKKIIEFCKDMLDIPMSLEYRISSQSWFTIRLTSLLMLERPIQCDIFRGSTHIICSSSVLFSPTSYAEIARIVGSIQALSSYRLFIRKNLSLIILVLILFYSIFEAYSLHFIPSVATVLKSNINVAIGFVFFIVGCLLAIEMEEYLAFQSDAIFSARILLRALHIETLETEAYLELLWRRQLYSEQLKILALFLIFMVIS